MGVAIGPPFAIIPVIASTTSPSKRRRPAACLPGRTVGKRLLLLTIMSTATPAQKVPTPEEEQSIQRKAAAEKWRIHCFKDYDGVRGIPREEITPELMEMVEESSGLTVAHVVAMIGDLDLLPTEWITKKKFYAQTDIRGRTVGHVAADHGQMGKIPSAIRRLPEFYSSGAAYATAAGRKLHHIPESLLERPETYTWGDDRGRTAAHGAAASGCLDRIKPELLTKEFFAIADKGGITVAHTAALHRHLYQVPHELQTREFFAQATPDGYTVGHAAAKGGSLHQVPPHLQTMDFYAMGDRELNRVAHVAAAAGHLDQVPASLKTKEFFAMHNRDFVTVYGAAVDNGNGHQVRGELFEDRYVRAKQQYDAAGTGRLPRDGRGSDALIRRAAAAKRRMERKGLTEDDLFKEVVENRAWLNSYAEASAKRTFDDKVDQEIKKRAQEAGIEPDKALLRGMSLGPPEVDEGTAQVPTPSAVPDMA